jgi:hypothetical protein
LPQIIQPSSGFGICRHLVVVDQIHRRGETGVLIGEALVGGD